MESLRVPRALLWPAVIAGAMAVALAAGSAPARSATTDLAIMGPAELTVSQLAEFHAASGHEARLPIPVAELAAMFIAEGADENVRGDIAFAQAIVETGYFTFPPEGQVRPEHHNYGGIGAVDHGRDPDRFASPRIGVRAQIQHLRAYADPGVTEENLAHPLVDPRFGYVEPKGSATTWRSLAGRWASDRAYGEKILDVYARMEAIVPRGPDRPDPNPNVVRVAGADRYATAAALAAAGWPPGVPTVLVASGANHADALAGGAAAAMLDAPLLLVAQDMVPDATARALERLRPARVLLLGGSTSIADATEDTLWRWAPVTRVAGNDRFATAAELAQRVWPEGADVVFVADGTGFADALAAAAVAGGERAPVLLTLPTRLPEPTVDALHELAPREIVVVGGPSAVGAPVIEALAGHATVHRLAGRTRHHTAVAAVGRAHPGGDVPALVATAWNWPDALAAAPAAARLGAAMLIADSDAVPDVVAAELHRLAPPRTWAVGGETALGDRALGDLDRLTRR